MKRRGVLRWSVTLGLIMLVAGILFAQSNPDQATPDRVLIVNGKAAGAPVVQINGHSYIELESLAQLLNATVTFETNRVVLTTSTQTGSDASAAEPPPISPAEPAEPPPPPAPPGISRAFASAAIAALSEMREWRGATTAVISYGIPVTGTWPQDYHDQAESVLRQAMIAASTDADINALQLLENDFSNMETWADNVVATRQALNAAPSVDPNALQNDTVLAKISACGSFLGSMIVTGTFSDDASCH
jgi:hypothetical protein